MTTTEGNKLIAGFMDFPVTESVKGALVWFDDDGAKDVLYHESWDWLMPVVEKISDIDDFAYEEDDAITTEQTKIVLTTHVCVSIETLYERVVKFINWYNNNKLK